MGLWSRLFRWRRAADIAAARRDEVAAAAPPSAEAPVTGNESPIELPAEPFVFECQSCGKVFEARRKRAACPECDSRDVSIVSE
jgi:Zn finger protein HypA/HybF involved in hydrogenase expression